MRNKNLINAATRNATYQSDGVNALRAFLEKNPALCEQIRNEPETEPAPSVLPALLRSLSPEQRRSILNTTPEQRRAELVEAGITGVVSIVDRARAHRRTQQAEGFLDTALDAGMSPRAILEPCIDEEQAQAADSFLSLCMPSVSSCVAEEDGPDDDGPGGAAKTARTTEALPIPAPWQRATEDFERLCGHHGWPPRPLAA